MQPQLTPEHVTSNTPVQPYVGLPKASFPVNAHVFVHDPEHADVVGVELEPDVLEVSDVVESVELEPDDPVLAVVVSEVVSDVEPVLAVVESVELEPDDPVLAVVVSEVVSDVEPVLAVVPVVGSHVTVAHDVPSP